MTTDPEHGGGRAARPAATRRRVLFLCTHNSARSQMAEGLLRALAGERFEAFSAGTRATAVRPLAVAAMGEIGIDIADQTSKSLDGFVDQPFDLVITLCDDAHETCPWFPLAVQRRHWSVPDPSQSTSVEAYRAARDAIKARIVGELLDTTRVRLARPDDAPAIARIYNQGIDDRLATFETEPRSAQDIARLLDDKGERYPTVVVERGGHVVAWATTGLYRSRACYAPVAEHSVYVDRAHRGSGAGRRALHGLIEQAERRGILKLVSRIFPENEASLALHRALGFREVGVYRRHGRLDGEWRDCVIVERLLGEAAH